MSKRREQLITTALFAIISQIAIMSTENSHAVPPKKGEKAVDCFGINSCKGTNGCTVIQEQINVANKIYKNKYAKSTLIECAGNSDCSAKKGFLAWIAKPNEGECFKSGGFIIEKKGSNDYVIRDKNGEKKE